MLVTAISPIKPTMAQSRAGHLGRRDGNSSHPETAHKMRVPIALLRMKTTVVVLTC